MSDTGFADFELDGFPAISVIMIAITTVLAALKAKSSGQLAIPTTGKAMVITSIFMIVISVFMVFASDQMRQIGVQLFICGIIGTFGTMAGNALALPVYLFFTGFTFLCMIGSLAAFSHSKIVYDVSKTDCANYFGRLADPPKRCDGYLEFLWIITSFSIYIVGLAVVLAFAAFSGMAEGGASGNSGNAGNNNKAVEEQA